MLSCPFSHSLGYGIVLKEIKIQREEIFVKVMLDVGNPGGLIAFGLVGFIALILVGVAIVAGIVLIVKAIVNASSEKEDSSEPVKAALDKED